MKDSIYENDIDETAERKLYTILSLCRVGVAASDSVMNVDLAKGGHCEMYEIIAKLAGEAVDMLGSVEPNS